MPCLLPILAVSLSACLSAAAGAAEPASAGGAATAGGEQALPSDPDLNEVPQTAQSPIAALARLPSEAAVPPPGGHWVVASARPAVARPAAARVPTEDEPRSGLVIVLGFAALLLGALAASWRWLSATQEAMRTRRGLAVSTEVRSTTVCLRRDERPVSDRLTARDKDRERAVAVAAAALAETDALAPDEHAAVVATELTRRITRKFQSTRRFKRSPAGAGEAAEDADG